MEEMAWRHPGSSTWAMDEMRPVTPPFSALEMIQLRNDGHAVPTCMHPDMVPTRASMSDAKFTPLTVTLITNGKTAYDALVSRVGPDLYRLDEELGLVLAADSDDDVPHLPRYGDTINTYSRDDGVLVFKSIHAKGPYQHFEFTLSKGAAQSSALSAFLQEITALGGHWQHIMGGLLFISIPDSSPIDVPAAVRRATGGP